MSKTHDTAATTGHYRDIEAHIAALAEKGYRVVNSVSARPEYITVFLERPVATRLHGGTTPKPPRMPTLPNPVDTGRVMPEGLVSDRQRVINDLREHQEKNARPWYMRFFR